MQRVSKSNGGSAAKGGSGGGGLVAAAAAAAAALPAGGQVAGRCRRRHCWRASCPHPSLGPTPWDNEKCQLCGKKGQ